MIQKYIFHQKWSTPMLCETHDEGIFLNWKTTTQQVNSKPDYRNTDDFESFGGCKIIIAGYILWNSVVSNFQ